MGTAKNLMLRLKRLQALLNDQNAAKHAQEEASIAAAQGSVPPVSDADREQKALLSELQELKAALHARHASHAQPPASAPTPTPAPAESHSHSHAGHSHSHSHSHEPEPEAPHTPRGAHVHKADRVGEIELTVAPEMQSQFAANDPVKQCREWATKYHGT